MSRTPRSGRSTEVADGWYAARLRLGDKSGDHTRTRCGGLVEMNLAVPRQASLGGTTATGQDANSMRPRLVEPTSMPAWGGAPRWPT
ncbi:MAG: hypothetical protein QOI75_5254, partial [Pseudonocardiales bacterium]|nr:hypothetical protein [Pseudonocardiales bacterium]